MPWDHPDAWAASKKRSPTPASNIGPCAQLRWLGADTLYITWQGKGSASLVHAAFAELKRMIADRPEPRVARLVCDTLQVKSYDSTLREPANLLLQELRGFGLREIVVVTHNPAIRMLGAALSLVVRCRLMVFASPDNALAHCAADLPAT